MYKRQELIDTPNPNAKKVMTDLSDDKLMNALTAIKGVSSVFFGPNFVTITKDENVEWESLSQDIINIFDKL